MRACPPTSSAGAAPRCGAQRQHLAGVRVGRVPLGVQVVAVVPDHGQPEVAHRREHGGAGADDGADLPRG